MSSTLEYLLSVKLVLRLQYSAYRLVLLETYIMDVVTCGRSGDSREYSRSRALFSPVAVWLLLNARLDLLNGFSGLGV